MDAKIGVKNYTGNVVAKWHTFDERVDAAAEVLCREDDQFTVPWKDVPQVHKENYLDLARRALRAAGVV